MTSATKLAQQQQEHLEEAKKCKALADKETDDELVEDLLNKVDEALEAAEALDDDRKKAEAREQRLNALLADRNPPDMPARELQGAEKKTSRVTIPATCRRWKPVNFRDEEVSGMRAEERAYAFGRYCLAVAAKTMPGRMGNHARYVRPHEEAFGELGFTDQKAGPFMAAAESGNAGIWVPDEFGTDLITLMERYGRARQLFNVLPMSSDKRTDPKEGSDPTPVFVGEAQEGSDNTPTDDSTVTKTARKLMAILLWSSELNEDAITQFGDSMIRRMANGFAKKEDECGLGAGDGTSTYGGMISVRTKLQDFDGAGTNSIGLVTGPAGTDTSWTSFTKDDLLEVVKLLPDYVESAEDNAVWVCHRAFYYQVMVALLLEQGGSPGMEMRDNFGQPMYLGWPVVFSNVFPKVPAATSVVATFGDHRRAVDFGDRRSYSLSFSDQATIGSVNLFSSDQVAVKATERFDIVVHSVGDATDAGPIVGLETVT